MNLQLLIERLLVIVRHDVRIKASYRMSTIVSVISGVSGMLAYGLLGNTAVVSVTSDAYGMSLTSYLVSGIAFSSIVNNGLGMFTEYAGSASIEEVMVTPTSFREYVFLSSILGILVSLGNAALFFMTSTLIFGLTFSYNIPILMLVICLGLLTSIGLGFIGLGFHLVYKQTSILSWLLFTLTGVTGNMIVPVEILPEAVRTLSYATPQYYFFTGIRAALGSDTIPLNTLLAVFSLYSLALLATGFFAFEHGMRFIRRKGTHRWV